jgi:ABC-2 type transport system ATP-binding protein
MDAVSKRYGAVMALDGVSFDLEENVIHGLLGRNGAGKTTAMQILTGQGFESGGRVEVFGQHPYENAAVLGRVCFVKESQIYPDMFRVRHALRAAERAFPEWDARFASELAADFGLPVDRKIKKLSRGMLSMVGVIIGLASRSPLTVFDEPYLGLDPVARQLFYDRLLADFSERPRTVVLSTHLIDEVGPLVENVIVIDRGQVVIDAEAESLRSAAIAVSGPASAVESFAAGRPELHREQVGGLLRVTVGGTPELPTDARLDVQPVSLQQLVVRTTQTKGAPADRPVAAKIAKRSVR